MNKQELLEQMASWAGELDIIVKHMKPECWEREILSVASRMAQCVHEESKFPIWISGAGAPKTFVE